MNEEAERSLADVAAAVKKTRLLQARMLIGEARTVGRIIGENQWSMVDRTLLWTFVLYALLHAPIWAIALALTLRLIVRLRMATSYANDFENITRAHLGDDVRNVEV